MIVDSQEKRERLLGQAGHLVDEVDALESLVEFVPEEILSSRPLDAEPSIKELYVLLGLYDCQIYFPALKAMTKGENPHLEEADDADLLAGRAWNEIPFPDVLQTLRETRSEMVVFLKTLQPEDWKRSARLGDRNLSVYDVVYGLVQHDAELLRSVAMRLYDVRALGFSAPTDSS